VAKALYQRTDELAVLLARRSPAVVGAEALSQIACTLSSVDVYSRGWAGAYNDVHCSGSSANGRQDTPWGLQPPDLMSEASGS
jgi:hypothetical protein